MAGDTPTPMYDKKVGTPFEDGDGIELHMASDFSEPYDTFSERQRVNESYEIPRDSGEVVNNIVEINFRPTHPSETALLGKHLIDARKFRMDPKDVLEGWDTAA